MFSVKNLENLGEMKKIIDGNPIAIIEDTIRIFLK